MTVFTEFLSNLFEYGLEFFGRYYSDYSAIVTNNDDPDGLGRIKVKCPQIFGSAEVDFWIYPKSIFAGKKFGIFAIPENGDTVWISFRGGLAKPEYALWQYGWWTKGNGVPNAQKGTYIFCTPKGNVVWIDDNNKKIYASVENGKEVVITDQKIFLSADNAASPAVLGDKNETVLTTIANDLQIIQTAFNTATDSLGVPIAALASAAGTIQVPTGSDITGTKSQSVFLE